MNATITWLGHAAFRLVLPDERVILIDPWLSENPACPANLKKPQRCDIIVLTHGHPDHAGDVPALVKAFDPYVVANYDLCMAMQNIIGTGRASGGHRSNRSRLYRCCDRRASGPGHGCTS